MSKTPIPPAMRQEVIDRDGIDCLRCGRACKKHLDGRVRPDTPAYDHVWPESKGGPTIVRNLQLLCTECNRMKAATHHDYRAAPIAGGAWSPKEVRSQNRSRPSKGQLRRLAHEVKREVKVLRHASLPHDVEAVLSTAQKNAPTHPSDLHIWQVTTRGLVEMAYMTAWRKADVYESLSPEERVAFDTAPQWIKDHWGEDTYPGWEKAAFPGDSEMQALYRAHS